MSKKKYIVRCPRLVASTACCSPMHLDCNHRVFDADYAGVEIKRPECRKVFEVKLEKKANCEIGYLVFYYLLGIMTHISMFRKCPAKIPCFMVFPVTIKK